MATLTDASADGKLQARYLNDRRGVALRAKYGAGQILLQQDFEPLGSVTYGDVTLTPQVRGSATTWGSGTSLNVPLPSGWQPGDLCIIAHTMLASAPSVNTPSGWSLREQKVSATNSNEVLSIFRRELQAGDGSVAFTFASGRHAFISVAIYDHEPGAPEDASSESDSNSGVTGASVRAPSITTVRDTALLLTFHAVRNGTSGVTNMSFTAPPGMTEVAEITSASTSSNTAIECAKQELTVAGATGSKIATLAGSTITSIDRVGATVAVRPRGQSSALPMAGAAAWKHIGIAGPHKIIYDVPGTASVPIQWCGLIMKSNDTPITVNASIAAIRSEVGVPSLPAVVPVVRSSDKYGSTASETSSTIPLPPGWQPGDLCYISYVLSGTSVVTTVPTGWTAVVPEFYATGSTGASHGTIKRILQAGDTSVAISHTSGRFSAISVAIYGHDPTTPEDVTPTTTSVAAGSISSVLSPAISPVSSDVLQLTFHCARNLVTNVTNMAWSPPSAMTEVNDVTSTSTSTNTTMEVAQRTLSSPSGNKSAGLTGSDLSNVNSLSSSILVRPADLGTPAVSGVPSVAATAPFNVPANSVVAVLISYNADSGDAAGEKITVTNNKSLTVTKAVERAHLEGGANGGAAIAYMISSGAQTGLVVTATISVVGASRDDFMMKVLILGNVDIANPVSGSPVEATPTANIHSLTLTSSIDQGIALWAITDAETIGAPTTIENIWGGFGGGSSAVKSASSPISGTQSLLNTWSTQQRIRMNINSADVITGPRAMQFSFKVLGTEEIDPTWVDRVSKSRLEVRFCDKSNKVWATNVLGFPGNVSRSWSTNFSIPAGSNLGRIEIIGYGWDASGSARFDEMVLSEVPPYAVRFVRKTDGGYVRGGHPALCVNGTAYAFDDELTPDQLTEWYAEPIFPDGSVGTPTGTVEFTIEDRSTDLWSTMIKSLENPGVVMFLPTDTREMTRQRSTTFVTKQSTGKPAGGINSAYSLSGDYMLITQTIAELKELMVLLDETVLYVSPTGRFHRPPFFATVLEYSINDFVRIDGEEKIFIIRFQEVERPDTEGQPSYLPLADYSWLSQQHSTYGDPALTSQTYDDLAFSSVI